MKTILTAACAGLLATTFITPAPADVQPAAVSVLKAARTGIDAAPYEIDRRGRRGRSRPRVPGGSGCDDPEDIVEHPECRA